MTTHSTVIDTPMGPVGVSWNCGRLTGIDLEPDSAGVTEGQLPEFVAKQIGAYFRDGSVHFDLALVLNGTPFQRRVWEALRSIPPGQTVTYGQLASELGTGARAIGGACRANPCPIVVPCHRVIAADGLGGFSGDTSGRKLAVKRWLLRHEGVAIEQAGSDAEPLGPSVRKGSAAFRHQERDGCEGLQGR